MPKNYFLLCLAFSALLAACQQTDSLPKPKKKETSSVDPNDIAVTINERSITHQLLAVFKKMQLEAHPEQTVSDETQLQQLIDIELWAQEAREKQLDQDQENVLRIKLLGKQLLATRAKEHRLLTKPIGADQINKAFKERYSSDNLQQVKVLIIENNDESQINELLNSLKMGADFKELARLATNSATQPEETEWIALNSLTDAQIAALSQIEDGQFTVQPIKEDNGWKILLKEKSRTAPAPTLNEVRNELLTSLQQEQLNVRTRVLRDNASIVIPGENPSEQSTDEKSTDVNTSDPHQTIPQITENNSNEPKPPLAEGE